MEDVLANMDVDRCIEGVLEATFEETFFTEYIIDFTPKAKSNFLQWPWMNTVHSTKQYVSNSNSVKSMIFSCQAMCRSIPVIKMFCYCFNN